MRAPERRVSTSRSLRFLAKQRKEYRAVVTRERANQGSGLLRGISKRSPA
jgi:hypothetical protein